MARVVLKPLALGNPPPPSRVQASQVGGANPAGGSRVAPRPFLPQPGSAFAREHTADRQINRLQENARSATQQARANPLANGNLLEGVVLAAGANAISHGLGQPIRGMLMGAMSAAVTWSFSKGTTPAANFVLTASGPATVDLWVYA